MWAKMAAVALVGLLLVSCGSDPPDDEASPNSKIGPCAPLVDDIFSRYQERIDEFTDVPLEELDSSDFAGPNEPATPEQKDFARRAEKLRCNPVDLYLITADRGHELQASTPGTTVAKAEWLSAIANAVFYAPDASDRFGPPRFEPGTHEPSNGVAEEDLEQIDFAGLSTCAELVDATLTLFQLDLNELARTPFETALTAQSPYTPIGAGRASELERARSASDCSRSEFATEFIGRAESLEARGVLANFAKAGYIEEQFQALDASHSGTSVTATLIPRVTVSAPGDTVTIDVTVENDGGTPIEYAELRETEQFGSSDATTVGLERLRTGPLDPGNKERFTVSFTVPEEASGVITVEYDTIKGFADGTWSSTGSGFQLRIR